MVEQVKDRVQNLSRRARHAIYGQEDHTVRNAISFAAGIGLGIGVGMLLAPSPGEETRCSIVGKVYDFGDKARVRFSPEVKKPSTGLEGMQAPRRAVGNRRLSVPAYSLRCTLPRPHGPAG